MQKVIECVPNFSEGRDLGIIRQITAAIESVDGVSLLNVDPGASTNRTVVTFAGTPEATVEAVSPDGDQVFTKLKQGDSDPLLAGWLASAGKDSLAR